MPQVTISNTCASTGTSGAAFGLATTKAKKFKDYYTRELILGSDTSREAFKISENPVYAKIAYIHIENSGAEDAHITVDSGGNLSHHRLPAGQVWEHWNTGFWNNGSGANPDTIDGINVVGKTGITETTVKVTVFI